MTEARQSNYPTEQGRLCAESLQRGLLLEDRPLLIPWKARLPQIHGACPPDRVESHLSWNELIWQDPVLLNGLHVQLVQAVLYPHGWLDSLQAMLEKGNDPQQVQAVFLRVRTHLVDLLGRPTSTSAQCNCEQIKDLAAWDWPQVRLALIWRLAEPFEGYTQVCLLNVSHR